VIKDLIIDNKIIKNRLFLGTGKFYSSEILKKTISMANIEIVTVALRRVDLNKKEDDILSAINTEKQILLPNTSGARTAEEAVRLARFARKLGAGNWIKLEVTPEPRYLLPDPIETLKASEILVKEGFVVLPYINADPVLAKRLEELGCATVMPLGSLIGTNRGIKTEELLKIIIQESKIPVIIDAGIGCPSDAAKAMELGADAVLVNTAIAISNNPPELALAFKLAVEAGLIAYNTGATYEKIITAAASSPLDNISL